MENRFGLTEILKHINDLAYSIDVDSVLTKAEAIFVKLNKDDEKVPARILDILYGRKTSDSPAEDVEGDDDEPDVAAEAEEETTGAEDAS